MSARTLAIGDIHGNLRALETVLEMVAPVRGDRLIFLGDYVNKGMDTCGVIERIIGLKSRLEVVCLLGNHDLVMREALKQPRNRSLFESWMGMGGRATLDSYMDGVPHAIPGTHIDFLDSCVLVHEDEKRIYVHGCVDADVPVAEQKPAVALWQRVHEAKPHVSGKMVICGHTSQKSGKPKDLGHTVCIDTNAGGKAGGGWLTCMDVDTLKCWQGNERGEGREMGLR